MMDDARLFRRTDPDFPTTRAMQQRLVAAACSFPSTKF